MPRPDFPFPGYWLGVGGKIQVHMGPHGIANSELYYLGTTPRSATDNTGIVDHIAFLATEPRSFSERFDALGLHAQKRYLPEFHLFQMFIEDPDGLTRSDWLAEIEALRREDEATWRTSRRGAVFHRTLHPREPHRYVQTRDPYELEALQDAQQRLFELGTFAGEDTRR